MRYHREPAFGQAGVAGERAGEQAEADYAALFREAGLDHDRLDAAEWGRRLAGRPRNLVAAIVAALDDWATVRRKAAAGPASPGTIRLLDAVRAIDPDPWRNDLRMAMAADDRKGLVRLANDPKLTEQSPASLVLLTLELEAIDQEELAVEALRRAQRRFPDNFPISQSLSWALVAPNIKTGKNKHDDGLRFATAAVALNPRAGMTRATLAMALADTGQFEAAELEFREAIRLQPDYPNIHTHYALMLRKVSRIEEAVTELREALRLKPEWTTARMFLESCLRALGRTDEAIGELREAVRNKPEDAVPHFRLGNTLRAQGKPEEAVAEYREAVRLDGERLGSAIWSLGDLLLDLERPDEAIAVYRRAREIGRANPGDIAKADAKIAAAERRKTGKDKPKNLIAELREAIRLRPDDAVAHNNLGWNLASQGKTDEAIAEYRKAIRLRPDYAVAHNNLGGTLKDLGKTDEAIAEYREATRIKPDYASAHYFLGVLLARLGRREEGVAAFREAVRLDGERLGTRHLDAGRPPPRPRTAR